MSASRLSHAYQQILLPLGLLGALALSGCGGSDPPSSSGTDNSVATSTPQQPVTSPSTGAAGPPKPVGDVSMPEPDPSKIQQKPPSQDPNTYVAATPENVGTKGKGYGGGIVTEPISQYFQLRDKVKLLELKSRIQSYEIEHGRKPQSHEEFVSGVLNAGLTKFELPSLPPGREYVWDAEKGELMVKITK